MTLNEAIFSQRDLTINDVPEKQREYFKVYSRGITTPDSVRKWLNMSSRQKKTFIQKEKRRTESRRLSGKREFIQNQIEERRKKLGRTLSREEIRKLKLNLANTYERLRKVGRA